MAYKKSNPNGQATMANSEPVVIASDQSAVPISVASLPLPSGAATSAKQDTGNTSLASLETKIGEVQASPTANTVLDRLKALLTELQLKADLTETQPVSLASVPSHAVTNAGTFAVQATEADGANATLGAKADARSTATDTTAVTIMQVLKEISYMEQNPASRAVTNAGTFATQATLQAGTNAIGKLAANSGVDIGDVDVTSLPALAAGTNAIGKLLPPDIDVTTHSNYAKKYYTNAGAVTDGIVWSPAAGKRWHVVSLFVNVSAAATVTFEDDKAGGDEAILKMELAANSGTVIPFPEKYPLASGEDAADLIVTTSAGNVYITCVGYEI